MRRKQYPIGFFHADITELRTEAGKLSLFAAIDRTSKFAFARRYDRADKQNAQDFLKLLIESVPYRIHTVLTDNGVQFIDLPRSQWLSLENISSGLPVGGMELSTV